MAFIFGLAFLVYPVRPNAGRWTLWLDLLLAILGVATIAYTFIDMDQFIRRSTLPEPMDLFFGIVAILLLLEISRRIVGQHLHPGRRGIPALHVFRELLPGHHFP